MVIENIISGKRNLFWVVFHAVLGLISTITPFALIAWFYLLLLSNSSKAIYQLRKGKSFFYIALIAYLISLEMIGRMTKAYPFIPLELSKYFLPLASIIGVMNSKKKGNNLWLILGFFISLGLLFDYSGERKFTDIINNYFGVLAIFFGLFFLSKQELSRESINSICKLVLLAILPSLLYCFIKTPDLEDISFNLSANFETTGGAATNQVSTVFGLGLFISFYFWYQRTTFSGYRIFDIVIGIAFLVQGLLTFSRGGMVVSIICIMLLVLKNINNFNSRNLILAALGLMAVFVVFNLIDDVTGGKLLLRYQGETEGTYNYGAEKTLKKMTSGRSLIFEEDLKLWYDYPIFGCGVGASRLIRSRMIDEKISSHVELSRLLAEHGIIGLVFFLYLINLGIKLWRNINVEPWRIILFLMYLIALLTSFHSAMRTFVTPLLIALSSIGMYNVKRITANGIIHRSN
jgi:hypothetical protein